MPIYIQIVPSVPCLPAHRARSTAKGRGGKEKTGNRKGKEEGKTHNIPRGVINRPYRSARVLIRRAQIPLLLLAIFAREFLRDGRVADALGDFSDNGQVPREGLHALAVP